METKMKYDSDGRHRRSIRLKDYDYSQEGAYFVTICTHRRECLFGKISDGEMNLNQIGTIVRDEWLRSAQVRREICLDAFVVMPNHLHGIVLILNDGPHGVGTTTGILNLREKTSSPAHRKQEGDRRSPLQARGPGRRSLSSFIAGFKSSCTRSINESPGTVGVSVWQRSFYEHVIRSENSLHAVRAYIEANPWQWAYDADNPDFINNKERPIS